MITLHFIRPWFLLGFIGLVVLAFLLKKHDLRARSWKAWCDKPLLEALMKQSPALKVTHWPFLTLFFSMSCMLIAASGPAFKRLPSPVFTEDSPKMILLDISQNMLAADLTPNRFQRALFVTQDLLSAPQIVPVGLIAYTEEPFIVSPLTEDAKTIAALLPSLNTDIAPIGGQNLAAALKEAFVLFNQAHFACGSILVLTGSPPNETAVDAATQLAQQGCHVSILPIIQFQGSLPNFKALADAGSGLVLPLQQAKSSIKRWLHFSSSHRGDMKTRHLAYPLWRDEGRWFLIPALLGLLPVFRRGWLRRVR